MGHGGEALLGPGMHMHPCLFAPPRAHDQARLSRSLRHCVRDVSRLSCSPWPTPFPPPPPPPLARACSAASRVLRGRQTSRARASRDYRLSVPLAARPHHHHHQDGRPRDLPVLAHEDLRACLASPTAQGPPAARANATENVAFRSFEQRRHPELEISRLNRPAHTPPANASAMPSRTPTHDSGPPWIATPSM